MTIKIKSDNGRPVLQGVQEASVQSGFLHAFFNTLNGMSVEYSVIRNYETLPQKVTGTDIDMVVRSADFRRITSAVDAVARSVGYARWKSYRKNYDIVQTSYAPIECENPEDVVRVDFMMDGVKWRGLDLMDPQVIWDNTVTLGGVRVLKDPAKTALTLINSLVFGSGLKEKYLAEYTSLEGGDKKRADKLISDSIGASAKHVIEHLAALSSQPSGHPASALDTRPIRSSFMKAKAMKAPSILSGLASWAKTSVTRLLAPPGLFVVFIGPDGCGKSTMNAEVQRRCARMFSGVDTFHLFPKPGIFASLDRKSMKRWEKRHTDRQEWELRSATFPAWKSIARCSYLLLRFWAGYLLWVYPRVSRGRLVIGERWCYDILFDPASKGIGLPYRLRRFFYSLCPSPSVTLVLAGAPEKMAERKKELPVGEITKQLDAMKKELGGRKGISIADSTAGIEETFKSVLKALISA
ncbi:MAG: hypothetical protein AABY51_04195 [Deltaproteobacteria bacterium]